MLKRQHCQPLRRLTTGRGRAGLCAAGLLAITAVAPVAAQQALPGLIVTVPPASAPPPAVQPKPAPPKVPPKAAAPKPAPKAARASPAPAGEGEPAGGSGKGSSGQAIAALVNDDPVTAYEVEQRARLNSLQSNIGERATESFKRMIQSETTNTRLRAILQETIEANPGKSREQIIAIFEERKKQFAQSLQRQAVESTRAGILPGLRKTALDEIIEERLKLQEAKRLNIAVDDAQVDGVLKGIAGRNNMTPEQFAQHMKGMGVDVNSMKARFRASLAWGDVVRRRFASQISINQRDIDKFVAAAGGDGEDEVELQLQRITLAVPGKLDQATMAARLRDADRLRSTFGGCKTAAVLATRTANAKFEDLGARRPNTLPEPTRTLLLSARDGEMVPPNMTQNGIELYALCGRKVLKADEQKRTVAQQELQQKEFEMMARSHLRDLRQDAHIEYR